LSTRLWTLAGPGSPSFDVLEDVFDPGFEHPGDAEGQGEDIDEDDDESSGVGPAPRWKLGF